jgi:hypothetical protein
MYFVLKQLLNTTTSYRIWYLISIIIIIIFIIAQKSDPRNRPWRPIGLSSVKDHIV